MIEVLFETKCKNGLVKNGDIERDIAKWIGYNKHFPGLFVTLF